MNYKMRVGLAIVLASLCVIAAHKIKIRSIENESSQSTSIVANSINRFSTDLYKVISRNALQENIICSTLSAALVLMMAANGAGGKTLEEMNRVLYINTDENIQKSGTHLLINQLNAVKEVELRLASNIFIKSGLVIKPDFETMCNTIFQSKVRNLNFTNSIAASQEINNWCEEKTNSRIKNIFEPGDFNDNTALVLVNAVYFKGKWAKKFNENSTSVGNFYFNNNTTKQVPMMHNLDKYLYGELPELSARFIELPYESIDNNDAVSMIIILPNEINGLRMIEENLSKVNISHLLTGVPYEVDLYLPKFKIESKIDLKMGLSELGMVDIFGNSANFTRIADQSPLKVTKIMQKAFIEVNEEGSEAAAVTEIELENRIGNDDVVKQTSFHVDRPFLSLIVSENVILFSAHVVSVNF